MMRVDPRIAALLIEKGEELFHAPAQPIRFSGNEHADRLLNDLDRYPHAFVIACIMDRQIKAERAWRVPYELSERLGGFSISHLLDQSLEQIRTAFSEPTALHRYDYMSGLAFRAIRQIAEDCGGDAARIWAGAPSSAEVVVRFLAFEGVGPKIATMAANILARDFKIPLADHYSIDVSADVHVRRVFERLGLVPPKASLDEVIYRARALYPTFPGLLDLPVWEIGRQWCRPVSPRCGECYMCDVCPSASPDRLAPPGQ